MRILLGFLLILTTGTLAAASDMEGLASWYGGKFHGRHTSSGEVFDTNEFTAAHKTLPFGTIVKVTNLDNGKTTIVKINDRGPFVEDRIIDLSRAAAEAIGMVGPGVARVSLQIVDFVSSAQMVSLQVGAYALPRNVEQARATLERAGFLVTTEQTTLGITRVLVRGILIRDLPDARARIERLGFMNYVVIKEKLALSETAATGAGPLAFASTTRR